MKYKYKRFKNAFIEKTKLLRNKEEVLAVASVIMLVDLWQAYCL